MIETASATLTSEMLRMFDDLPMFFWNLVHRFGIIADAFANRKGCFQRICNA